MARTRKPPTVKTIRATLAKLMRDVAAVYGGDGRADLSKTNERGTITVEWRDGRTVLEEKPEGGATL